MNLSGTWRAAVADDQLRRAAPDADFDDRDWEPIDVPGHWQSTSAFAGSDGPLLYRTRFEHPSDLGSDRRWLVLDGLFYQGDVWLDGTYLGDTEGYFSPHTFEVTAPLSARSEHVLTVEVSCPKPSNRTTKRQLTGSYQDPSLVGPSWNPGGIWRPVRLEATGPVRIRDLQVLCREANAQRAVVALRANLETASPRSVLVRSGVGTTDTSLRRPLAAGQNWVEWTVTVADPDLWWPWSMGAQPLSEVWVEVLVDEDELVAEDAGSAGGNDDAPRRKAADRAADGEVSHRRGVPIGLRQVELRHWALHVNGERLFLKGANLGPTRPDPGNPETAGGAAADVGRARSAGLDLLRIQGHIAPPELYQAADETGMLLWQDLPLEGGYARGTRVQAVRQARQAVQVLGHHPSVALWCGHHDPDDVDAPLPFPLLEDESPGWLGRLAAAQVPSWNRTVLDRSIRRALSKADSTRPVVAHSWVLPHLPQIDGTDTELSLGWRRGDERDLPGLAKALPRLVRFVGSFGSQSLPDDTDRSVGKKWPDVDWAALEALGADRSAFERHLPPEQFATFDDWLEAGQRYQANLLRHHVEHLRRLKYHPTTGFTYGLLADAVPAVSLALLDHARDAKPGWDALVAACRPVIVTADRLPAMVTPGERLRLDVHVVSDCREPLADASVTALVAWPGGQRRWWWGGDIPADRCTRVGRIDLDVPAVNGPLTLDLVLEGPWEASNRDETTVTIE